MGYKLWGLLSCFWIVCLGEGGAEVGGAPVASVSSPGRTSQDA